MTSIGLIEFQAEVTMGAASPKSKDVCRTPIEIVCAVADEKPVTVEELKLALLCYSHYASEVWRLHREIAEDGKLSLKNEMHIKDDYYWRMIKTPADRWLGEGLTPGTEEYKQRQKVAKAIYKQATGEDL